MNSILKPELNWNLTENRCVLYVVQGIHLGSHEMAPVVRVAPAAAAALAGLLATGG